MAGADDVARTLLSGLGEVVRALMAMRTALSVTLAASESHGINGMEDTYNEHMANIAVVATPATEALTASNAAGKEKKQKRKKQKHASSKIRPRPLSVTYIDSGPEDDETVTRSI